MSAAPGRIVLKTPRTVGQAGEFSALEACRSHSLASRDAASEASASAERARLHANVAQSASEALFAAAGAVKASPTDQVPASLDECLEVAAPLCKAVTGPGGDESLALSVSVMSGAEIDASGASGLVPQPQAGDARSFLRGDGVWKRLDRSDAGMELVEDAWTVLDGPVEVLGAGLARVPGDQLALALPGGLAGRALRPDFPSGARGCVAAAHYDESAQATVIRVDGFALDPACEALLLGQDPRNAPEHSDAGSSLYLAANFNCLTY